MATSLESLPATDNTSVIDRVERGDRSLVVHWRDGHRSRFHYMWLRDNCLCEFCGDPVIGRKRLRIVDIPPDISPDFVGHEDAGHDDAKLTVTWRPDGHVSTYDPAWLRRHCYSAAARAGRRQQPMPWRAAPNGRPPEIDYSDVRSGDAGLLHLLRRVRGYGLCILRDVPAKVGELEKAARLVGPIRTSVFGDIFEIILTPEEKSIANSLDELVPHTDEPYRNAPPGIAFFHCLAADPKGGGTSLYVDGFRVAEALRRADPDAFDLLSRHPLPYRRHYEDETDVEGGGRIICLDHLGNVEGVRFNDRVAAPLDLPEEVMDRFYAAYRKLMGLFTKAEFATRIHLRPGDLVVSDNHRVLHGRTPLSPTGGFRHMRLCHVDRGAFHSRLRILSRRLRPGDVEPVPPRGAIT